MEAVVAAVSALESDALFNAGTGAKLQADGRARLSASLMDGPTERFAGVINVEGLLHPIQLARHLLDDDARVLDGEGALARARELGLQEGDVRTPQSIAEWEDARGAGTIGRGGTVGAVALDSAGRLAAATSTGGRGMERPGRVSDSATPAGTFASPRAAVSCTGWGEQILGGGLAVRVVQSVEHGADAHTAAQGLLMHMLDRDWQAGFIALDADGTWSVAHTTPVMAWHIRAQDLDAGFLAPPPPPRKPWE